MSEIQEKLFFLQCKYEVAHKALLDVRQVVNEIVSFHSQTFLDVITPALEQIKEIETTEKKRDAMREPTVPYDTF